MKDIIDRLNSFADWHTSCNGGNVSEEAQTCMDAAARIKELEEELLAKDSKSPITAYIDKQACPSDLWWLERDAFEGWK
jgi:hypothetical protein